MKAASSYLLLFLAGRPSPVLQEEIVQTLKKTDPEASLVADSLLSLLSGQKLKGESRHENIALHMYVSEIVQDRASK